MGLPESLDEWTLKLVLKLAQTASENQDFDFKDAAVMRDPGGIGSLSKSVAAFSNARGGFVIIGVTDREPRVVHGVETTLEFAKHLNDRIKVYPAPEITVKLLPHQDRRSVVVMQVAPGREGPYAAVHDKRTEFYIRTPSGAEPMSWIAIRDAMVRADERRRQGEILLTQLQQWHLTARNHSLAERHGNDFPETEFWDLTLAYQAYVAIHPWLSKSPAAMQLLGLTFQRVNFLNGQVQAMIAQVGSHPTALPRWRGRMAVNVRGLRDALIQADANLRDALGMPRVADYRSLYPEY